MASALISALQRLRLLLFMTLPCFGDQFNITAVIGENPILPCRAENRPILLVEWKRTDIKEGNILQYRNGVDKGDQHPSFKDRVFFQDIEMKDGDVSLVLINLRTDDSGTYEGEVAYYGVNSKKKLVCTIHLDVAPPPPPPPESFPSRAALLVIAGVLVLILIVVLFYHRCCRLKSDPKVEVKEGEECVLLPCRTRDKLPGDAKVEWMDIRYRKVHVFENGSAQAGEQDGFYRTRTKMNKYPLRTGDLSLTLRDPIHEDSGTFSCSVYSKERIILMMKEVHLKVKVPQVEGEPGQESVLLPCRTRDNLPGDARVEWMDQWDRKVHVYENGSDQPGEQNQFYRTRTQMKEDLLRTGDLSLTLRDPTERDSGIFTCIIYIEEGDILMKKDVQLWVKGSVQIQPEDIRTRRFITDPNPLMAEQAV